MFKEIFKTIKEKCLNHNFYAIDIGTTKIVVAIICFDSITLQYKVEGMTSCNSRGIDRSNVHDSIKISENIKSCINFLKDKTNYTAKKAYINLSDPSIQDLESYGVVKIKSGIIEQEDIEQAVNSAKIINLQKNFEIVQVIKNSFLIDNNLFTNKPLGMLGTRLEIQVKVVIASSYCINKLNNIFYNCNIILDGTLIDIFSNGSLALTKQEKNKGTCFIDIGAGTTKVIIFYKNKVKIFFIVPIAGNQITNDISQGLVLSNNIAENIKCNILCDDTINILSNTHNFKKEKLLKIIEARIEEIFSIVFNYLSNNDAINIISSIYVTGGSSNFKNLMIKIIEKIFNLPVKIYTSNNLENFGIIKDPRYSSIEGLIHYKLKEKQKEIKQKNFKLYNKIKNWIK